MLGDVLLIAEKHNEAADTIMEYIPMKEGNKFIIAISGESGSGKTELAHVLAKKLKNKGVVAKPLHADNYYRIHPLERTEWRKTHGINKTVGLGEYDWEKMNENIEDFKNNRISNMPCIDLVTEQIDMLTTDFNGIDMLIVDGLYAINSDYADLRVFIELTYHETKKAQSARGKEPQNEYRMRVLEREHQVVQSMKPKADLLVTKEYMVVKA